MKSHIAIYDLQTRSYQDVLVLDQHVEAPNWTPDGSALIVNSGGLLYRLPLDAPGLEVINTGFAHRINNDHGISFDGKQLVISDSSQYGSSAIYVLPASGGEPCQVTALQPSYWHGWSPDGATVAYVANRDGRFQVYTCPLTGGEETRLTQDFDHCDGPDYSPDGEWIWFNGEKSGSVQLWRMHIDGSGLQQMTADERVNWFPHPSPDGQMILYLAYANGTQGHPANRQVELRLMPAAGGMSETLTHFLGGQGSINVPCWAPDSQRFAFVHYTTDSR